MRIEIDRHDTRLVIDTASGKLAGEWFAEQLAKLMSANAAMAPATLRVWPNSGDEAEAIGRAQWAMAEDDLRAFAESLIAGADRLKAAAKVRR